MPEFDSHPQNDSSANRSSPIRLPIDLLIDYSCTPQEMETGAAPQWIQNPAHRLFFKQAKLTVLVGLVLGAMLSLLQIGIDYASEKRRHQSRNPVTA